MREPQWDHDDEWPKWTQEETYARYALMTAATNFIFPQNSTYINLMVTYFYSIYDGILKYSLYVFVLKNLLVKCIVASAVVLDVKTEN